MTQNVVSLNTDTKTLGDVKSMIPDYAKDIKLNLSNIMNDETLNTQQLWGSILASALATGNQTLINAAKTDAQDNLSAEAYTATQSAAAIMAMNNVYYRFVHLSSNKEYQTMPAKLRMNVMADPGVDKADFELWSLAVSAINGCGMCIDAHEAELRGHGVTSAQIHTSIRVASTIHAVAAVLSGEGVV